MAPDFSRLAYWLLKDVQRAIRDYGMLADGDRVAVAVSGGKDSLSLLRLLDIRRQVMPERYHVVAVHVVGDARGSAIACHRPLVEWLAAQGYESEVVSLHLPADEPLPLNCQRCTWNRRRTLFEAAHRLGCNVVAFGHHADDLAQTTLMTLLTGSKVETMAPRRDYFDGTLRLIRPLCYVPEKEIRRFARSCDFPSSPEDCPRSSESRRRRAAEFLRLVERDFPNARTNLLRAGLRGEGGNTSAERGSQALDNVACRDDMSSGRTID
jgi:tRNA 2-thiocytidine biosynthesis protein TtcA